MLTSKYEVDKTTQYWVIRPYTFSFKYVTWPCYLDLRPFDPGVLSRDATWVVNPCTTFELDTTYRSRVTTTKIFRWLQVLRFCGV